MSGSIIERFEVRRLPSATPEQALGYLRWLAFLVESGEEKRQVLAANVVEPGQKGSLSPEDQSVVKAIAIREGWRLVSDEVWEEAMELFVEEYGCDPLAKGIETRFPKKEGCFRQETRIPTATEGISLVRVEEYSEDMGTLTLLSFEIARDKKR